MFEQLEALPLLAKYANQQRVDADARPGAIDLCTGVIRDADGSCPVFPEVKIAERRRVEREATKDYQPLGGSDAFRTTLAELVLGAGHPALARTEVLQTPGGTAALRATGELYRRAFGGTTLHISEPTWGNHIRIFEDAGLELARFSWCDQATWTQDFDALREALSAIPAGALVLLQACCHNPSGLDPTLEQWRELAAVARESGWLPLLDIAFFGVGRGLEADLAGVRAFAESGECLVAVSLSKAFAIYRERVGAVLVVGDDAERATRATRHLRRVLRGAWSTSPAHGAAIVAEVLGDPELRAGWADGLERKRRRILALRERLPAALAEAGVAGDFSYMPRQTGIFTPLGLTPEEVTAIRERHALHLPSSGWLNVAALADDWVAPLCAAIAEVRR